MSLSGGGVPARPARRHRRAIARAPELTRCSKHPDPSSWSPSRAAHAPVGLGRSSLDGETTSAVRRGASMTGDALVPSEEGNASPRTAKVRGVRPSLTASRLTSSYATDRASGRPGLRLRLLGVTTTAAQKARPGALSRGPRREARATRRRRGRDSSAKVRFAGPRDADRGQPPRAEEDSGLGNVPVCLLGCRYSSSHRLPCFIVSGPSGGVGARLALPETSS